MGTDSHDTRSVDDLIACVQRGGRIKPIFYWGHTPAAGDSVDKACLSQWYAAQFAVDGIHYPTAEH